jgi:hypothetical protein
MAVKAFVDVLLPRQDWSLILTVRWRWDAGRGRRAGP